MWKVDAEREELIRREHENETRRQIREWFVNTLYQLDILTALEASEVYKLCYKKKCEEAAISFHPRWGK